MKNCNAENINTSIHSIQWVNYEVYKPKAEEAIVCILCEGSHGNNTLCQMSWEDAHEIF